MKVCGGVESLLAHEEAAEGFIEVPALEVAAKVLAEDRSPSLLGQQIDSYKILSLLGAGGMGAVYRAHDSRLGREVAIKVLPSAFATDAERLRRFEQEARAAGRLNHPNFLAIYHVGTHEGSPYIVCERLKGETLRDRLKGTALPQRKAVEVAVEIARGLAAAHEKGIVHRDLKPENLFLTSDGRLKILDFGLAKLTRPQSDGSRTDTTETQVGTLSGLVLGTMGYMAPEQVRGEVVDHRADLFNFGAILYEMLSGQRAFRGKSDVETMHAIVKEEPSDLSGANPPIPSVLQRIIRHCLEKTPQERYQSASDIAFDLELLTDPASMPSGQLAATAQKRDRLGWIAAAVLSLIVLALAVAYFRRAPTDGQAVYFWVPPPETTTFTGGTRPAISPDGRSLAFVADDSSGKSRLYVRAFDRPAAQVLDGTEGAWGPFWSPGLLSTESHVAYTLGYLLFIRDWVLMAQAFDPKRLQFTGEPFPVADQVMSSVNGMRGSFSVSEAGALAYFRGSDIRQLAWFNRSGEELGPVGAPDAYSYPSLSPDEKTIAVTKNTTHGNKDRDIWLIDLRRGHPSRFTFDPEPDFLPIWSPDGSRIVFTSSRNGSWDLYQKAVGSTAQEELLLKSNDGKFPTDWSRDGRFIAYNRGGPGGGPGVWVLPLFGDRKPIPFVQSEFQQLFGYFSPDGRWLAYVSDESGRAEVYVRPFPVSAGISPVSTGGGRQPRWRRDGRELFYLSLDGKLMVVEVNAGDRFRAGVPKALFQMRLPMDFDWSSGNYAVTADGQRFLVTTPAGEAASPAISVVLNWPAALKKGPLQ